MENQSDLTFLGASDVTGDKLYVISGPMRGHTFDLKREITIIGRAYDTDIQIRDSSVSRRHAEIIHRGDMFFVKDLKSRNGTWINGISIAAGNEFEVAEGVPIALGETFINLGKEYLGDISPNEYSIDLSGWKGERTKNLLYKDRRITDREKLELIYEVSTVLMQTLDINEICEQILESLFSCLKRIDGGVILLTNDDTGEIKEITARARKKKKNIKIDFSRTIVNRVINDGKAIAMSDTSREDGINLSDSIGKMRIRSIMCVPLISKAATRGVIYVHSVGRPNAFRKDDLFLLTGLSSPAALAIENALLYCKRKRAEEALERANDGLERRIEDRTSELKEVNMQLEQELNERNRTEEALQESQKKLHFLSSHLLTAQEREQRRISLELHDDLGQSLAVLKLHLQSIHDKTPQDNRTIKKDLAASLNSVDQIIESVRRLSRDLSPSILEDLGLSAALRWLVREFEERFKIKFTSSIPEIDNLFPREGQTLIYRIFQEAFTNIGKHAQANHVSVVIKKEERRVSFLVEDDGIGFDVEEQDVLDHTEKGMGLSAMDERVRMLGGQLEVSSQGNQGTTISFIIPIEK